MLIKNQMRPRFKTIQNCTLFDILVEHVFQTVALYFKIFQQTLRKANIIFLLLLVKQHF